MRPLSQRRPLTQIAMLLLCLPALLWGAAGGARASGVFPHGALPDRWSAGRPAPQEAGPPPVFEFHSGFWVNLHHFLYRLAHAQKDSSRLATSLGGVKLTEVEQRAWQAAVDYYAAKYADLDLVVNSDLIILKDQLADVENCELISGRSGPRCDASLPKDITHVLESAAPVYRAHWWSDHDRANRRWTAQVAPMVRQWGKDLAAELARIYQVKWPSARIRVDVTAYANSAGAYTTLDPLRVTMASLDARNQGPAAFEVLFHEASHGLAQPVQAAIVRECRARGKPIPRDLWHAIVFYTTGEAVKNVLSQAGEDAGGAAKSYTPYAVREGLYTRGWSNYLRVIEQFWQPYLEGKTDFGDAIARMVSSL